MDEPLPLATIHDAILEFLRGRDDVALFGAQAVNAYVDEARMTQDVDILALRGKEFAEEVRTFLNERFHIAARVREVRDGFGYRVDQVRKPKNRHLVDVRSIPLLPPTARIRQVRVIDPPELIARKTITWMSRRRKPKAGIDWRDIALLLLAFPELKKGEGAVRDRLIANNAPLECLQAWNDLVEQTIEVEHDDDKFECQQPLLQ